jgi:two-component system sensor histidine kinase MprB
VTGWLRRESFRVRLGALVAVAVGVTVALAALAAYIAVHHELYNQLDSTLNRDTGALLSSQQDLESSRVEALLNRYNDTLIQVIDSQGGVVSTGINSGPTSATLPVGRSDIRIAQAGADGGSSYRDITAQGQRYRMVTVGAGLDQAGVPIGTVAVQIAVPLTNVIGTLSDLRLILWLVTAGGIALAVVMGYLVGRATIRPVERLTAAAEHVASTQDLSATIDDHGADELGRLAHAFNSMLHALASSRQQQAQLISDAGHELRTPLTSLRTNIEVLLRVPNLPDRDRTELLGDVHAQLEELTTLIGDVVELGRAEEHASLPIEVRLDAILERAVERARRRAPSVEFEVRATPGSIRAQPALLERAILNVLDNAAKWSPPAGTVRVWLQRGPVWALDVLDQGPGIPAEDLPHIFDRFYRAAASRSMPGSGLGLAIVRQVVTAHGGSVGAASPPGGGTQIHIELPIVAEQEPGLDGPDGGHPPPALDGPHTDQPALPAGGR